MLGVTHPTPSPGLGGDATQQLFCIWWRHLLYTLTPTCYSAGSRKWGDCHECDTGQNHTRLLPIVHLYAAVTVACRLQVPVGWRQSGPLTGSQFAQPRQVSKAAAMGQQIASVRKTKPCLGYWTRHQTDAHLLNLQICLNDGSMLLQVPLGW